MHDPRFDPFTPRSSGRFPAAITLGCLVALISSCHRSPVIHTRGAGHAITADIQGDHSVAKHETHTTLSSQFGAVTVERTRVRIEGQNWTAIPAEVPVNVSIRQHKLRITAGPGTVTRTVSN